MAEPAPMPAPMPAAMPAPPISADGPAAAGVAAADGRRARRREVARNRLYDAAISLFIELGYAATTMDAIAERADVARGTVFNHFPQKVAFLQEWGRRRREHVAEALAAHDALGEPTVALLRRYMRELAVLSASSRAETVQLVDAAARYGELLRGAPLAAALAEIVELGQARGEFRANAQPELVGAVLAGVYFSTVLRWIAQEPAPFPLADQLDAMLDIVLTGLVAAAASAPAVVAEAGAGAKRARRAPGRS